MSSSALEEEYDGGGESDSSSISSRSRSRSVSPANSSASNSSSRSRSVSPGRKKKKKKKVKGKKKKRGRPKYKTIVSKKEIKHFYGPHRLTFQSPDGFKKRRVPNKACRYLLSHCSRRHLTARDKRTRQALITLNKRKR